MSCRRDLIIHPEPSVEQSDIIISSSKREITFLNSDLLKSSPQPPTGLSVAFQDYLEVDFTIASPGSGNYSFIADWIYQPDGQLIFDKYDDLYLENISWTLQTDSDTSTARYDLYYREDLYPTDNGVAIETAFSTGVVSASIESFDEEIDKDFRTELFSNNRGLDWLQFLSFQTQVGGGSSNLQGTLTMIGTGFE